MTTTWNAETMELSRQLGFDADNLRANQAGRLSERQWRGLRRELIFSIPLYVITADVVLLLGLPLVTSERYQVFFVLIAFVITVRFLVDWLKTASELRQGEPVVVEGVAHRITWTFRHFYGLFNPRRYLGPRYSTTYFLEINGVEFSPPYKQLTALVDGRWYRLYCLPLSKTILSADRG